MPSTYTLNNGIELIGTGEQSGTWGDTTNTNFELVDTALDGQVTVTLASAGTSGAPNTLPISDGSSSNGRNRMVIFNDGADLGATAYVQLTPNDAEKIVYIRNNLSASRSIIVFQGTYSASNDYEIPAGTTAVIYFNGAGAGAVAANVFNNAYFDSLRLGSVSVTAILDEDNMASNSATALATQQSIKAYVDAQVGANNELSEVLANGNTTGGNNIQMTTTDEVQFRDTALKISSSVDGQLDIDADVEVEIVAPTLDIDASTAVTIDTATLTMTGSVNVVGDLDVDNLNLNGNSIISTNANGNIALTPNGTGEVDISKVDIDGGTIDGTTIGGASAAAGTFTTATATTGNITTVNATTVDTTNAEVTNIKAKDGTASATIADSTGVMTIASSVLTTTDINGGTIDGTTIGGASAAAGTFTTVTASGDLTIADKIVHSGDTNTSIRFPAADTVTVETSGTERMRIDSSGRLLVGTSSATGSANLQVQTPSTLSATGDAGVYFVNTSTKTYPTTSSYTVRPGLYQSIELGTAQVVDSVTPGGFNYVSGFENSLTKSAGNTQDIDRLLFDGFKNTCTWDDANTCKQYISFNDLFIYSGINANGRTSSFFRADTIRLIAPDGGTQTISSIISNALTCRPQGNSTINITNSVNTAPNLSISNFDAGTKTVNITSHTFFGTSAFWGVSGTTGTLTATVTNLYGLRLTAPNSTAGLTITNNWGIRQEWSSAKNWFAGASNQFPNITTTASAANAFLDTGDNNRLYVSTSSIEYKTDVENLDPTYADNILNLRPVWYRSTAAADPSGWSYYGLIAEEVAAVEPRLVHYGYKQSDYEEVIVTEEVRIDEIRPGYDEANPDKTETVERTERRLKAGAVKAPNGVAYERLSVMLLDIIKRQSQQIEALEARVAALETA